MPSEHYHEAELLLQRANTAAAMGDDNDVDHLVNLAYVHALLATVSPEVAVVAGYPNKS